MSVIIRLQNLPWSASAADIRQFFRGLSIPEGGVHIVGGDLGDAFIAFSSDEDARQGMALDGQFIAGARIKLLLSSRSEMQKIIEQARQQAMQAVAAASPTYQPAQPVPQAAPVTGNLYAAQPTQPPAVPPMQQYPQKTYPDQQGFSNGPRFAGMQNNNGTAPPPFAPGGPQRYSYGMGPSYGNPQLNDRNTSSAPAQEEKPYPGRLQPYFERQQPYPDRNQPYPERNQPYAERNQPFPERNQPYPERNQLHPERNQPYPERNQPYPERNQPFPERNQPYPERNQPFPERNQPYPERQQPYSDRQGQQPESVMGRRGSREFQDRNGPGGGRADGRDRDSGRRERRGSRERDRDRSQREDSREKRKGKRSRSRSRSRERARPRRRSSSRDRKTSKDERGGSGSNNSAKPRQGLNSANPDETKNGSSRESKNAVQFRMLTGDLTYKDIREFFHGIRVPSVGIKMVNGVDGYRFGFAYISFTYKRDKEEAMARNDALIRGSPVQITPVEDSVFEDAIDSFSPGVPLGNFSFDKSCFILRDVPQDVTDAEVAKAFEGFMVKNIVPEMDPNGKPSGIWYVQLASDSEFKRALQMFANGFYIRGLRMKIAVLPLEELNRRLKTLPVAGRKQNNEEPVIPAAFPSRKSRFEPNEGDGRRVNISGLPLSALERDLVDFFSDVGVIPMMIQLKVDKNGAPTGEAFCEFSTFQECQKAVTKNGAFMAGRTITVVLEPGPQPLLSSPEVEEAPAGDFYQATGPGGPRPGPPRQGGPDGPRPRPQRFAGPPRYPTANSQPGFMRPRQPNWPVRPPVGPEMVPDMGGAPRRMPVDPGIPLNGPPMGMPMGPGPGGPMPPGPIVGPGPMPPGPTGGFGAPGCVVALSNVPFKATIDDILNFFSGFPITEKCIIRRFSNTGHPTGDARVALPTPMDAQHAVQTLQGGYIYDRSISLAVL